MVKGFAIQQPPHMDENKSNMTCASFEVSGSSTINRNDSRGIYPTDFGFSSLNQPQPHVLKKKRNQPCQPDPEAEVVAYSPRTLFSTNRFVCEICNKGFQRDQNLQLHRRGHNLPWKLQKKNEKEAIKKKVYVCPEISCAHHDPSRALGDLTGLRKHFFRKHGEKKWTCDKCSKRYAVQADWKAHAKICGTREYSCECGMLFSRKDSFIFHKGLCGASAERQTPITLSNSLSLKPPASTSLTTSHHMLNFQHQTQPHLNPFPFPSNGEQQISSTLSPEHPPWIAYSPHIGPAAPMHQTTQSPSLLQEYFHQSFAPTHHNHDDHNMNPNPTTIPLYYPSPPPPASPTGVFINPHQTHMSPHEEFSQSLGSYGVKADAVMGGSTESGVTAGDTCDFLSSTFFLDDHMTIMNNSHHSLSNSGSGFISSTNLFHGDHMTFMNNNHHPLSNSSAGLEENVLFGGIMNHQSSEGSENLHATPSQVEGGDDDEMTRDFLGLKSLFQNDYLQEYSWFKGLFEQKC